MMNEKEIREKEVAWVLTPEGQISYWQQIFLGTQDAKVRSFALKGIQRAHDQKWGWQNA